MRRRMLAITVLAAAAVTAGCSGGEPRESAAVADTLNRDLQLAPADTTGVALNDRPADTAAAPTTPPAAEPAPTTPTRPTQRPSRPTRQNPPTSTTTRPSTGGTSGGTTARAVSLAEGTSFSATTTEEISSAANKVGNTVSARVDRDVKDASGRVVIPAGSTVNMEITALHESENKSDTTGTVTLAVRSVSIGGRDVPLDARISGLHSELRGRKTNAGDVAKVGAGAAAGAVVGRVLGGSGKGAVIGGIIGGAVGAQRAVETKDRDVVVPSGSSITLVLEDTFTRPTT